MKKRVISMLLVLWMVLGLLPATALATDAESTAYISVSCDEKYVTANDASHTVMAYVPVKLSELSAMTLADYGLDTFASDANGDGVEDITLLHLYLYIIEKYYMGYTDGTKIVPGMTKAAEDDDFFAISVSGSAGAMYFSNFWGHDENLTYYVNGAFPLDSSLGSGMGATADRIVLNNGDFVDLSMYSDGNFWSDSNAGYHYFFQGGSWIENIIHAGTVAIGQPFRVGLGRSWSSFGGSSAITMEGSDYEICYSQTLYDTHAECVKTDADGTVSVTFSREGTWYLWADGALGGEVADSVVSSPAYCKLTVFAAPTSQWKNFRNSDFNMGITTARTPRNAETTALRWYNKIGSGWSNSPSVQIIVDNCLVTLTTGKKILKLSLTDGTEVASGTLAAATNFGYTPPTYVEKLGLIIAPLANGTLQAFNALTLESVWVYQDNPNADAGNQGNADGLRGQALSPVTYADGKLYTGFWNGETQNANFVCVDADTGKLEWCYAVAGGFYWAGSVAAGNYIVVGTDDGQNGCTGDSRLLAFKKTYGDSETVAPVSSVVLTGCGDQRSSLALSDGKVYFTTKGGYLCSATVDSTTGEISNLLAGALNAQATSTPLIYGNYVYFGAGSGISASGSSGNFVIANKNTLDVVDYVELRGYPQNSMLLSTAYLATDGYLYFYSTYNNLPGGVSLIKVKDGVPGDSKLIEIYDAEGFEQYCITSMICDTDGNLYYKNDAGVILSVGCNNAYLSALSANAGLGLENFKVSGLSYELIVPAGTKSVSFTATPCEGGTVQINNTFSSAVGLTNGVATASIKVTKDNDTRIYTISIRETGTDAALSALLVNESNSYSGAKTLFPDFSASNTGYLCLNVGAGRVYENVWPTTADPNATVKVYALSNVDPDEIEADGTIAITGTNSGHARYAVYFADDAKPMSIRMVVTAEDGTHTRSYNLTLTKKDAYELSADIAVTIADKGAITVPRKTVTVTDLDYDGKLTVDEALYAAHEAYYQGGAVKGYATATSQYGLGITKLWGDSSTNFGYFLDNAMCMSPADEIAAGQSLAAYITANAYPGADAYAYFDSATYDATARTGRTVTLKYQSGYDANWQPEFAEYNAATITAYDSTFAALSNTAYTVVNNNDGTYFISFNRAGSYYIVATAANNAIVPAVASVTASAAYVPSTPDTITVTFRLIGAEKSIQDVNLTDSDYLPDYITWIPTTAYTLKRNASVGELFKKALDTEKLGYVGLTQNYVSTIYAPSVLGGYALSEFTNGQRSGWMYTVNGLHPDQGLNTWALSDGDVVVWHYVNDYSYEVADWFDEEDYPALGDGTYYNGWLKAADKAPATRPNPVDPDNSAKPTGLPFTDVKDHWALDAIRFLFDRNLMQGDGDRFNPEGALNRAMLVTILYRLENEPAVTAANPFTDVPTGQWYSNAIIWAGENKIVDGYGNGLFGPMNRITREQMAKMLFSYSKYKGYDVTGTNGLTAFADAGDVSNWALDAMEWANAANLVAGRTETSLVPGGDTKRCEAATILMRYIENTVN